MKTLMMLLVMLAACGECGAISCSKNAPRLHSVLEKTQERGDYVTAFYFRISPEASADIPGQRFQKGTAPSTRNHAKDSKGLIIAGSLCLIVGVPGFIYGYAHMNDSDSRGSGWYSLGAIDLVIGLGIVAMVVGTTLLASGIAVRKHYHIREW